MAQESWNLDASDSSSSCPQPPQQDGLVLCSNNCGFFGSSSTLNLCSKCFHELVSQKEAPLGTFPAASDPQSLALAAASVEKSVMSALSDKSLASLSASDKPALPPSIFKSHEAPLSNSSFKIMRKNTIRNIQFVPGVARSSVDVKARADVPSVGTDAMAPSPPQACSSESSPLEPDLGSLRSLFSPENKATEPSPASSQRNPNRCFLCRKRTGLLGFKCRCGDVFCSSHRHSAKHDCPFDYKAAAREAIAKANPVVRATKIHKI